MWKTFLVDDEYDIREGLKSLDVWRTCGFEIAGVFSNGIEAFDAYVESKPDLVITDIKMPGMDGLELARKIRETDREALIIIMSGFNYFEYARKSIQYGVEDYLLKPIDFEELAKILMKIHETLELKKIRSLSLRDEIEETIRNTGFEENDRLKLILDHIRHNFNGKLALKQLAEEFHFHPFYLGQLIKEHTGNSFNAYLNVLRIQKAKQLLESTEIRIEDICMMVGYNFQDHFYRKFKEFVHISPNEYRKMMRNSIHG